MAPKLIAMFSRKKRPPMPEQTDVNTPPATGSTHPQEALANEGHHTHEDALTKASEAAAEHGLHDAEADGREDVHALTAELGEAKARLAELNDRWLRLQAEFDNFRKRTAKEKLDLLQFAGENALKNLLPVLDDMERAIANNERTADLAVVKEGFHLIHSKMLHILGSQGVKPMEDPRGKPFDTDRHEAVTKAPAPTKEQKGCVIDVLEHGYTMHDKVIRYAKVVVGE